MKFFAVHDTLGLMAAKALAFFLLFHFDWRPKLINKIRTVDNWHCLCQSLFVMQIDDNYLLL